jgi:uncharacterized membrane protein
MFHIHHFFDVHWIWGGVISTVLQLAIFGAIPYRSRRNFQENLLNILTKRFVRDEIDLEEFEERKQTLKGSN